MKRHISISFYFGHSDPSHSEVEQAFAELGWTVVHYGGGSSNIDRCYLTLESEDGHMDHPTLKATLTRLGIPLTEDTSVFGDLPVERKLDIYWTECRAVSIQDVHLEILDITPGEPGRFPTKAGSTKTRLVPSVNVRCMLSPHGDGPLEFPLVIKVDAFSEDNKPLAAGSINWTSGETLSGSKEIVVGIPIGNKRLAALNLLVRIFDIHRAGEVMFRSVPVTSDRQS